MECLTSRENPVIKQYRKLAQSRREREASGRFVMEGARLCSDAAACGIRIDTLLVSECADRYPDAVQQLLKACSRTFSISDALAGYISDTEHPQGIFAIGEIPQQTAALPKSGTCIFLDGLQDPGNLGTIIRTAESMGVDALLLSQGCPDCFSPKVVRSTMGSCFRQKIWRTENLSHTMKAMQGDGLLCYAATLTPDAVPLQKLPHIPFSGIVIGNEGNGVSDEVIECCDGRVYIPMGGAAESLNAAVAAAICMWELSGKYIG